VRGNNDVQLSVVLGIGVAGQSHREAGSKQRPAGPVRPRSHRRFVHPVFL